MGKYLITKNFQLLLVDCRYDGRMKLSEGDFYINVQSIEENPDDKPSVFSRNKHYRFSQPLEEASFENVLEEWRRNTLTLYRGLPGCHYSWSSFMQGELRGEGNVDYPTYSMDVGGTSWLPSDDIAMAQIVANQCNDAYTKTKSFFEPIATAFVVSINCGVHSGRVICWLNDGEIAIKGPLIFGQYRMHSILWLDALMPDWHPWPIALRDIYVLPPQRPFKPGSSDLIRDWWIACQPWVDRILSCDDVLALRLKVKRANRRVLAAGLDARRKALGYTD
ncbi:hypothetical protein [Pseudoduganella chitinolytica]|uniref:DUF3396 domain-containing protein n=1 Tax=Pseudoduganella chitinolytica TaxID=34070 RepID=A0ABY8BGY3_9BURK|nr:hypothetical protein [Pseudoduganella chitinolytica]WEF34228.1 hypothetical protein PX653_05510 [Pseudoduganella chitinolytica]